MTEDFAGAREAIPPSLVDEAAERRLQTFGYATLPLLDSNRVAEIREIYAALHPDTPAGFTSDMDAIDPGLKRQVTERLRPIWEAALLPLLDDHRLIVSWFCMKCPDDASSLPLHRHWSSVNEMSYRALTAWVPLDDATSALDNGPLSVVPGSHKASPLLFGSGLDPWYEGFESDLQELMIPIDTAAGTAVVMDDRLVHGSDRNRSTVARLAVAVSVVPNEARLLHAVSVDRNRVRIYQVPDDFLSRRDVPRTGVDIHGAEAHLKRFDITESDLVAEISQDHEPSDWSPIRTARTLLEREATTTARIHSGVSRPWTHRLTHRLSRLKRPHRHQDDPTEG